jgi:hypothetical protein
MKLVAIAQIFNQWLFEHQAYKISVPRRRIVYESFAKAVVGIVFVLKARSRATVYFTE